MKSKYQINLCHSPANVCHMIQLEFLLKAENGRALCGIVLLCLELLNDRMQKNNWAMQYHQYEERATSKPETPFQTTLA